MIAKSIKTVNTLTALLDQTLQQTDLTIKRAITSHLANACIKEWGIGQEAIHQETTYSFCEWLLGFVKFRLSLLGHVTVAFGDVAVASWNYKYQFLCFSTLIVKVRHD